MHHLLAGSGIRLTYLQDRRALAAIDWPGVYDDLADAGVPLNFWRWCDLDALTHVVLATDRDTGRYIGVLGLTRHTAPVDAWMLIETALVRPCDNDGKLVRSMLAHVLARIVCLDGKPTAIAAARGNQGALHDLSIAIRSATLHPHFHGNVIAFPAARLAREIGGGKMVLDLRPASEASLLRDLRGLHGVRAERRKVDGVMDKAARNASATRRPRKTTRTGRTG